MICLGIESTAHTFGVGIIDNKGKILANALDMFTTKEGGMILGEVAKHHRACTDRILLEALQEAKLTLADIDLISYSRGPGLPPSLKVGMEFAKDLAEKNSIPLVGVNHCVAHLTIGKQITSAKDPVYLYVSGVNSQVIAFIEGRFRIFGETLDLGLGNALDKFARDAGLGFPGGPAIEQMAKKGSYIDLPYAVKGMDVSFSGIATRARQLLQKGVKVEDICYSLQEVCFSMLTEVAERAMAHTGKQEVILIGGVAANKRFCEMLSIMAAERGARFIPVPMKYCGDQGVMIAWQGILEYKPEGGNKAIDIYSKERTDECEF